jgi:hypothetical protein
MLHKYAPEKIYSAVYYDGKQKYYYVKRFAADPSEKPSPFIDEHSRSYLVLLSEQVHPRVEIRFGGKHKNRKNEVIDLSEFIAVKGYKAKGKRLTNYEVKEIVELEPINFQSLVAEPVPEPEDRPVQEKPDKPGKPGKFEGLTKPKEPVKPEKPAGSKESVKTEEPARFEKQRKSKESLKTEGPVKPERQGKKEGRGKPELQDKHEEKIKPEVQKKTMEPEMAKEKEKPKKTGKKKGSNTGGQMSLF